MPNPHNDRQPTPGSAVSNATADVTRTPSSGTIQVSGGQGDFQDSPAAPEQELRQFDRLCDEYESNWKSGQCPQIEDFLARCPEPRRAALLAEMIALEVVYRRDRGETPNPAEYAARFSEYPSAIDAAFARRLGVADTDSFSSTAHATRFTGAGSVILPQLVEYEVLQEIARGGMGVVFKARQVKLNRIVALKMILAGQLASEEHVRRFHAEAQAAAHLDHPGIVPIYEVGEHEGQHYYSMGFVDGNSLAARLADGPLPPREAAELLLKTTRAVAYAHRQGVLHRDLKPANILVDAAGQPRVTDFGLAKRVEADSVVTAAGAILGTPSFMPPEQAAGRSEAIGPLADVYALGSTLYCLVTGRPPFQAAHVAETLRQVIDQEPVSPRQLNASVDRDLETICLKCLQKEPAQRYGSAEALADDLERYLQGRPIQARPISRLARTLRWCRRNPRVAALVGAFLTTLVVGSVISTWFGIQSTVHARFYRQEKIRADQETTRTRDALLAKNAALAMTEDSIDQYVETVRSAEQLRDARLQPLMKELLKHALAHYERYVAAHEQDRDAATRANLGRALWEIGWINERSGSIGDARAAYQRALAIRKLLVEENPAVQKHQRDLAGNHNDLGLLHGQTGEVDEALKSHQQALAIRERLAAESPAMTEYQTDVAGSHVNFGVLYQETGKPELAFAAFARADVIWRRLAKENPSATDFQLEVARNLHNIAALQSRTGKLPEAIETYRQSLSVRARLAEENPSLARYQHELALVHHDMALAHMQAGELDDALRAFRKALDIRVGLARENPTVFEYQSMLAQSYSSLAQFHGQTGKPEEAVKLFQQALPIRERLAKENATVTQFQSDLAGTHHDIGVAFHQLGLAAEALKAYQQALLLHERLVQEAVGNPQFRSELALAHFNIALLHSQSGKAAEALASYQQALTIQQRLANEHPTITQYQSELAATHKGAGNVYAGIGKADEALQAHQQAMTIRERLSRENPAHQRYQNDLAESHNGIGRLYSSVNKLEEALAQYQQAIVLQERLAGENLSVTEYQSDLAGTHNNIAIAYEGRGMIPEAIAAHQRALAVREQLALANPGVSDFQGEWAASQHNFGLLLGKNGKPAEARKLFLQAMTIAEHLVQERPGDLHFQLIAANSRLSIAELIRDDDPQAATAHLDAAIEMLQRVLDRDPQDAQARSIFQVAYLYRAEAHDRLHRYAAAAADWGQLILLHDGKNSFALLKAKCASLSRCGDHKQAAIELDKLAAGVRQSETLVELARAYALAAAAAICDESLAPQDRASLTEDYEAKAVALLERAGQAGYFRAAEPLHDLQTSPDFAALRWREDFRAVMAR